MGAAWRSKGRWCGRKEDRIGILGLEVPVK